MIGLLDAQGRVLWEDTLQQIILILQGRWWMLGYACEGELSDVLLRDLWACCESHLFAPPEVG